MSTPSFRAPNFKGKNKLFRHEVHNIRLGVGYTVIGKHTIRLLVDRLTAEETLKIADPSHSGAESVLHMEVCDLALTYGNREFNYIKRTLEPLCLTTKIVLHYHQRIAKILLSAFAEHIECDSYFALMNLTMAFARDIGKLFIPYFDLFSKALIRGMYDKETGTRFIAKADRLQLTFTALSALVIGIGGIASNGLSATAVATPQNDYANADEDDLTATYESSFVPSIPAVLTEEQKGLVGAIRRVVALVVERTFRDTKDYVRRLGAETIAALCRRHPRLLPIALSVCTQAVGIEVRAARKSKQHEPTTKDGEERGVDDNDSADEGEGSDEGASGSDEEGDGEVAEGDEEALGSEVGDEKPLEEAVAKAPVEASELKSSATADSMLFLTHNLLIGIKGALTTNFESSLTSIINALINQSHGDAEGKSPLCPQSLHTIATHVISGTFTVLIESVRNDQTKAAIPRVLSALVEQLLPPALKMLEGELHFTPTHSSDHTSSHGAANATTANGYTARYLRSALAVLSASGQAVLNRALDDDTTTSAVKAVTDGVLSILKNARTLMVPKAPAPANLPILFADSLLLTQALVLTDRYTSPAAMKVGEAFVAAMLAEAGRMLQMACATTNKSHILTMAHTLKDYAQDVSQKSVAHAARFSQRTDDDGGLSMPCFDEFLVAVFVVITSKIVNGHLESTFRRELLDTVMIIAEIAHSTLPAASAKAGVATVPNLFVRIVAARVPPPPQPQVKGAVKKTPQPKQMSSVLKEWASEDLASAVSEMENATTNEGHFLRQLERATVWMSLLPSIDLGLIGMIEPCVSAAGDLLTAGKKDTKVYLSAKLRTRLLQTYVRGSAALSRSSDSSDNSKTTSAVAKLSALIRQIAAAIPAGFHCASDHQKHPTKPQTEADAEANDTTISLLLAAFDRLRTTAEADGRAADGDASRWIDTSIDPSCYDDFVFLLMHSLATTRNSSTRLSTLVLLRDCYMYQHRKHHKSLCFIVSSMLSSGPQGGVAEQTAIAYDSNIFDMLIRCEKTDPLSEGLDAKGNILAPIVFDAANTTNFFDRYRGRSDAFMLQLLVRYCFGVLNVKFSPMWSLAVRMMSCLIRCELLKKGTSEISLWERLGEPLIIAAVLGNKEGSTHSAHHTEFDDDIAPITAAITEGVYPLAFDDSQLHASGALVSRAFRRVSVDSVRSRAVHSLTDGQRLYMADIAFGAAANGEGHAALQSTDSATVCRVLLNTLIYVADHLHHSKSVSAGGRVLSLPEQLVVRLAESDIGITYEAGDEKILGLTSVPTTTNTKALNQRLEMSLLAMSVQFSLHTDALKEAGSATSKALSRRAAVLESALLQYVCSPDTRLQAASIEALRKMRIAPYSTYHEYLFPICGGRLTIGDVSAKNNTNNNSKKGAAGVDSAPKRLGTSNAKGALTFLQSFNLETSIKEEHRVSYITALLLICLPVLTSTGRAGSGGNAHKKVRDREVLGRKVFALLSRVKGDGESDALAMVVDVLMERILDLPPAKATNEDAEDTYARYDLCAQFANTTLTIPKLRRKYEQFNKRLLSAMKLLVALVPAVGSRFEKYANTCFLLILHTHEASMPSVIVKRAGLESSVRLPGDLGNSIRKLAVGLMKDLLDTYPAPIADLILSSETFTSLLMTTLSSIFAHAPLAVSLTNSLQVGTRGGTTAPLPPPIELARTLSHHIALMPFLIASAESFLLPSIERYFRLTASDAVVLAVLDIVGRTIGHADERLSAVYVSGALTATTLRKGFLEPYGEAVFSALHRFVTSTSDDVLAEVPTAKKDRTGAQNPLRVSPKIWKDVILLASALPEYIRGGNAGVEFLEENMSQLLEIAINFARSPVCAADRASADMAAETIESIIKQVPKIHPTNHFRRLMHLFNRVTAPVARTVLCSALRIAVTKIEGMTDLGTMLQLQAVARCVSCMNAFGRSDGDMDAVPSGAKRGRAANSEKEPEVDKEGDVEQDDLDAYDFSRYDFELRYHAFYSLTSFLNKGAGEKGASAVNKTNKSIISGQKQRKFIGDQDVEIPITIEQPRLTMESAALLALNLLFFIRDRERTIRTFAGESIHALIRYVSHYPYFTGTDSTIDSLSDSTSVLVDPLNQLIRPVLLPAFRRGIVSKDSSSRLEHMQGFGYLAQHLPTHFPSLSILYSPNAEASFYSCIVSAQHRVRMNALGFLRKKCGLMHQREVLRVFVPFVVTYLKDYAQGKQDARTEQVSEAKQKGFADSLLMTLAAISSHMPWEGYHRILSVLLREATEHEALRAVMLKGIVRVLESFHFLETDVSTGERRIAEKVEEWADDEELDVVEDKGAADGGQDINDASAELATSALAPSARAERKNIRIMAVLEDEVLPQLYGFILAQKKSKVSKDLEGTLNESNKGAKGQDRKNEPRASVQLPVAVGILKIIRLFPQQRFDYHVDILLNEIVLKLRTKNDKQRETSRNVLFAMMNEAGPQKLRFVVTKLKDNLVHGYQLHVLGYTLVGLLHSMFGYAGERPTVVNEVSAEVEEAPKEEGEGEGADDSDSDSEDEKDASAEKKEGDADEEDQLATTDGKKAPSAKKMPPKVIMPHTPEDEKRMIGKAFRMGGTRRRIFSAEESTAALDAVMGDLFDVFVDDYLGEVGDQKEQTELMSTLREVKHNKSLQGFSFLAMYCSGDKVMDMFVTKIRWVLAPPSAKELLKNTSNSAHTMGNNIKYMHGDKKRSADARFVERVRVLAVRVAKSLILNQTLSLGSALTSSLTMLNRNNTLREAKIAEFEAKDGTRRIRGNIDQFTAAKRLTLQEQRDKNYVVEQRPDRIDVDFSSHTVLATQHKQKLRVYKGGYAKHMKETSKGFRLEDQESAVVLDTLDEFNLKFLLLLLKKALGIGRINAVKKKATKIVTEEAAEGEGEQGDPEQDQAKEAEEGADDEDTLEASPLEEGYDEMELFERQQRHDDALGEGRAVQRRAEKAAKAAKAERTLAELFGDEHKGQLSELLVPVLAILQGEGADSVITTGFEVTHALLAINPPLPSVKTSGQVLFDVIADLFDRGGDVKPRAMKVMAALVQHMYFNVSNEQALWLTKVSRGELIERTKNLTMGLSLLQAVVNKHIEIVEVYELIDSVTELMMHKAHSVPIRNRCVSIIAKFLTEYRLTMQKLQSHINMYVQNLQYPTVDGRLAMLELLGVLVFRLPQQVLREEGNVLFIPLVHCMSESPWASCQEKAAVVIQSLVLNAGLDVVAKTITVWLQSETMKTREYAMQVLAVILPVVPQLYGVDPTEETVASDAGAKSDRFEVVKAATEWVISELQHAIVYDHPLSKSKQQQIKEEIHKATLAGGKKGAQDISMLVARRIRGEKEMSSWNFSFFALRAVEALTLISPSFCAYFAEGDNAVIMKHLAKSLVTHSHPWVRSAATRIVDNYIKGFVFATIPYANLSLKWDLNKVDAIDENSAFLALPVVVVNNTATVSASTEQLQGVQEDAKRLCKQLLVVISNSDVKDELHYGFKAIDDPFRPVLVSLTVNLIRIMAVTALLLKDSSALCSVWSQLGSMIDPVLLGKTVRGYLVRSATMVQLIGGFIKHLPFGSQVVGGARLVSDIVSVKTLESSIVPFVGICAESTEISHRVSEFGIATVEVMKQVVGAHGASFEGADEEESAIRDPTARRSKKRRGEGEGSILASAAAAAAASRSAHAAVALALTRITDEIKERQRKAKIAEMHEKNFKKAQRQEKYAEKMVAMSKKRTGGKRRSRYS